MTGATAPRIIQSTQVKKIHSGIFQSGIFSVHGCPILQPHCTVQAESTDILAATPISASAGARIAKTIPLFP